MSAPARSAVTDASDAEFSAKSEAARRAGLVWRRAGVTQRVAALRRVWREVANRQTRGA